jgi:hypothetical protein
MSNQGLIKVRGRSIELLYFERLTDLAEHGRLAK